MDSRLRGNDEVNDAKGIREGALAYEVTYAPKTAIVIGGGIAGCSTAYALATHGIVVTLIERHDKLAQEASGNPLAMLYPKLALKPTSASALALQGFQFTLNLLNNLPNSSQFFNACGQIQLAFNAREQARQAAMVANTHFQLLNAAEASKVAGITLKNGGLYLPQAGWIMPAALCETLCSGAQITRLTSNAALKIKKQGSNWCVETANKQLEADIVVICNANEIKQFLQCESVAITPVRGQINFFAANAASAALKTILCSDHYLSPAVGGRHAIGTSYAPNDTNAEISESDTNTNLVALEHIAPQILGEIERNLITARVAWRSATLDYMPLAGQLVDEEKLRENPPRYNANPADLPWLHGLYVNAGHGSKGMTTAPICGELIANLASSSTLNMDAKLASRLNPSRFTLRELGLKLLAASLYK